MPPAQSAAVAYADAIERGDAAQVRALLTERARAEFDEAAVGRLLRENKNELQRSSKWIKAAHLGSGLEPSTNALLVFENGSEVRLEIEEGSFRLAGGGTLPAAPPTPQAAAAELKLALQRRSLPALLALLDESKRQEVEGQLDALMAALEQLDVALVETKGDRAEMSLPAGVTLVLSRKSGAWKIEEIR